MNGRSIEEQARYDAEREQLIQAFLQKYGSDGLVASDLTDFHPVLDSGKPTDYIRVIDELVDKFHLPIKVALSEVNGLYDGQINFLRLYNWGIRGSHLRQWKSVNGSGFNAAHQAGFLTAYNLFKVTAEQAIAAISQIDPSLENIVLYLLSQWVEKKIDLSLGSITTIINSATNKFEPKIQAIKKRALNELFIRWLNKEIQLTDIEAANAISLLDAQDFRGFRATVPMSDDQTNELANLLALAAIRNGDITVAIRLHERHKINLVVLTQALIAADSMQISGISDLLKLPAYRKFIPLLMDGLSELEISNSIDKNFIQKICDWKLCLDETMHLVDDALFVIREYGFTPNEATLFACSPELRGLIAHGVFDNPLMQDLARAASTPADLTESISHTYLKDVKQNISKTELYAMMSKYMLKFAKKAIDEELTAYLNRNYIAFNQRYNRAESLKTAAASCTDRGEVKALVKYQFGLLTNTIPADQIKGNRKHELPLSKPVQPEDDYYQTISRLNDSPYLNN